MGAAGALVADRAGLPAGSRRWWARSTCPSGPPPTTAARRAAAACGRWPVSGPGGAPVVDGVAGQQLHRLALFGFSDPVVAERGVDAAMVHQVSQHRGRHALIGQGLGVGVAEGVRGGSRSGQTGSARPCSLAGPASMRGMRATHVRIHTRSVRGPGGWCRRCSCRAGQKPQLVAGVAGKRSATQICCCADGFRPVRSPRSAGVGPSARPCGCRRSALAVPCSSTSRQSWCRLATSPARRPVPLSS